MLLPYPCGGHFVRRSEDSAFARFSWCSAPLNYPREDLARGEITLGRDYAGHATPYHGRTAPEWAPVPIAEA